jgi:hypothetical protein
MSIKKSLLIVGSRSKIAQDINNFLYKKYKIRFLSFNKVKKLSYKELSSFNYIVNCSFNKNCFEKKCNSDIKICDKLKKNLFNTKYIMLSSGKVYGVNKKNSEDLKCIPISKYGKYRLNTEKYLQKRLKENLLILRISNVLNFDLRFNSASKTVINTMLIDLLTKKKITIPKKKNFKDFITLNYLISCIDKLIEKDLKGIFNISSHIKISLNDVAKGLIKGFGVGKINLINEITENFSITNDLITKAIGIKLTRKKILVEVEKIGIKLKSQNI